MKVPVCRGGRSGHSGGEVGSEDPGNPEQQRGESLGPDFGAGGQWSLKFHGLDGLQRNSLSRGEVDEQDGGADDQREVGHS